MVYSLTLGPFKHWPHFVAARFLSEVPSPVDSAGQGHQSSSYWGQGSVHFYQCSSFTLTPQTRPWGSSLYILNISLKNIIMHMLLCYTQLYHYHRHILHKNFNNLCTLFNIMIMTCICLYNRQNICYGTCLMT